MEIALLPFLMYPSVNIASLGFLPFPALPVDPRIQDCVETHRSLRCFQGTFWGRSRGDDERVRIDRHAGRPPGQRVDQLVEVPPAHTRAGRTGGAGGEALLNASCCRSHLVEPRKTEEVVVARDGLTAARRDFLEAGGPTG